MTTLGIIQARMGSSRLPSKVLKKLGGVRCWSAWSGPPSESGVLDRAGRGDHRPRPGRRDRHGVRRDRRAVPPRTGRRRARPVPRRARPLPDSDAVLRFTADCPMLDPQVVALAHRVFTAAGAGLPDHLDHPDAAARPGRRAGPHAGAARARQLATDHHRTHVTSYIYTHPDDFDVAGMTLQPDLSHLRLTLDTEDDWRLIEADVAHFGDEPVGVRELTGFLVGRPDLLRVERPRVARRPSWKHDHMTIVGFALRCRAAHRGGHLVRCVALAEELVSRRSASGSSRPRRPGVGRALSSPSAACPGIRRRSTRSGWSRRPTGCARRADRRLVHVAAAAQRRGSPVRRVLCCAIVDGDPRGQTADIYVDQNLDAVITADDDAIGLAGLDYALLRDSVRRLRPLHAPVHASPRTPKVVAFFGGRRLPGGRPRSPPARPDRGAFDATVVAADESLRRDLRATGGRGSVSTVIAPTDELPKLLADADLAVSASGTSTWELLCLGLAAALVWVVDDQTRVTSGRSPKGTRRVSAASVELADRRVGLLRDLLTSPVAHCAGHPGLVRGGRPGRGTGGRRAAR